MTNLRFEAMLGRGSLNGLRHIWIMCEEKLTLIYYNLSFLNVCICVYVCICNLQCFHRLEAHSL